MTATDTRRRPPAPTPGGTAPARPPGRGPAAAARPPAGWWTTGIAADAGALFVLAFAVLAFSGSWLDGSLVLDGPGAALWVDLVQHHLDAGGFSYWMPEVWSGTPTWALAPSLPVFILAPLASMVGADTAVRLASVAGQVVGAWGVYVLARSLWGHRVPSMVAGLFYALHPVLIAHSALAGHQPAVEVMALTPWLVWSLRRALRGDGAHFVALAGLVAGLGVLFQPEHAYGLVLIVMAMLAVEIAHSRTRGGARGWRGVVVRAGVVGAIAGGMLAYWALPFVRLSDSFVLTPPSIVRSTLVEGIGGAVGRDPGLILSRASELDGVTSFQNTDFLDAGGFYVSWVCLALTLVTIAVLRRRDDDGHLTAILLAAAIAVWLQTGGIPLASSGLVRSTSVVAFVLIGTVAGLLVGSFLHQLRFGRLAAVAGVATAAFLVTLPYVAPFLTLQRFVPLLSSVRFPRLFPIAALGLALGAAYVLVMVREWAKTQVAPLAALATTIAALVITGAFLVDIQPYRSFYRVDPPRAISSYQRASEVMSATGDGYRAAGSLDPRATEPILEAGRRTSTGWPHPVASRRVWRVTAEAIFVSPPGFRDAALALSGTSHVVSERLANPVNVPGPLIDGVDVEPNAYVLPVVRAYEQAIVVGHDDITPELAVALAQRHIGVVSGGAHEVAALGSTVTGVVEPGNPCDQVFAGVNDVDRRLAGEIGTACALHRWVGVFIRSDFINVGRQGVGARLLATADGLRGIGVWLDRPPGPTEMVLYELGEDGRTFGAEVRRTIASGYDDTGIAAFAFDPIVASAGTQYVFVLSCPRCPEGGDPDLVTAGNDRAPGNLVVDGQLDSSSVVAFSVAYDRMPTAEAPTTQLTAFNSKPGEWAITSKGDRPSLVVVAESWFPGWKATVDGTDTPVMIADGAFLGIAVGPGEHEIRLRYAAPSIALVGRAISFTATAAGLALLAAGLVRTRRSKGRRRPAGEGGPDGAAGPLADGWQKSVDLVRNQWPRWWRPLPDRRNPIEPPRRPEARPLR